MKCSLRPFLVISLAFLALLPSWAARAQQEDSTAGDNVPKFASTSDEAVLLRYKYKAGDVEKIALDIDMDMTVRLGKTTLPMKMNMHIDAKSVTTAVASNGDFSAIVKITRMRMTTTSGANNVEFDTDKPSDDPSFKGISAMINVGIPCKMSPVGKMLETDMEPIRQAVRKVGNDALVKSLEDSTNQMFGGAYVQLSEDPVKAGDTFQAGTVLSGKAKVHNSYKVLSVSGDKSEAILQTVPVIELAPDAFPKGMEAKLTSQKVNGWMLFDVANGHAAKADIRMHMKMDLKTSGEQGDIDMTVRSKMTATVE